MKRAIDTTKTADENYKEILACLGLTSGYSDRVEVRSVTKRIGTRFSGKQLLVGIQFRAHVGHVGSGRWQKPRYEMRRVMVKNNEIDLKELEKKFNEISDLKAAANRAMEASAQAAKTREEKEKEIRKENGLSEYCDAIKLSGETIQLKLSLTMEQFKKFMSLAKEDGIKVGY